MVGHDTLLKLSGTNLCFDSWDDVYLEVIYLYSFGWSHWKYFQRFPALGVTSSAFLNGGWNDCLNVDQLVLKP